MQATSFVPRKATMGAELSKDKASQGQASAQQKHYETDQAEPHPQLPSTPTVKHQTNQAEPPPPQQSTPTILKHQTDQAEPRPRPSTPPVKCALSKPTSTVQTKPIDNEGKTVEINSVGNIRKTTPHNFEAILKDADFPINKSEQLGQLPAGIPLNQKNMASLPSTLDLYYYFFPFSLYFFKNRK